MGEESYDARLRTPFTLQICGPTQSGKTTFCKNLLRYNQELFTKPASEILWVTRSSSPVEIFDRSSDGGGGHPVVKVFHEVPRDWEEFLEKNSKRGKESHRVLVIDDFAQQLKEDRGLTNLFLVTSHHEYVSIILISQQIKWKSAEANTRADNTHYFVLLTTPRKSQVVRFAAEYARGETASFMSAYEDAISRKRGYLFIGLHPEDDKMLMYRTNILPNETPHVVYKLQ